MYKCLILSLSLVLVSSLTARADSPAPAATPSQAALLDVLKSNAPLEQKAIACHQLAWIGNRDAVPVLAGLLTEEKLSHMARYALEQIPDPSVEEALRAAVPKLKGKLLAGVLSSLGVRRDEKSIDMLSEKLKDSDADVANAAAFALGKIGTPAAADAILQPMFRTGTKAPAIYDAALRCADRLVAEGHMHEAVRLFRSVTNSPEAPKPCQIAADRGAKLNGQHFPPFLATLLESDDKGMFNLALELIQECPDVDATAAYVSHVGKLPAAKQALLIQALGKRGDKSALPAIRAAASQKESVVRIAVIRSLALFDDAQSLPIILDATVSPEKEISDAATDAIVKMPGAAVDSALVAMVVSSDGNKRRAAIDCLGRRRTTSATQALLKLVADEDPQIRQAAVKALAQVAGEADLPEAVHVLLKAASPADRTAAKNVVIAICVSAADKEACADKAIDLLVQAHADAKLLLHLLPAIGGAKGLTAVRTAMKAESKDMRDAAIVALCDWPDQAAAPDLLALARDETKGNYKIRGLRGYLRLALDVDLAADKRLEMAAAAQPLIERDDERRLLLRVLSRIQSPKALAMIEPFLDAPALKADAATAAVAVAGKLVQTPDARASAAAVVAAMEKVKQANPNPELIKKASDIQERARPSQPK